ncbi:CdaR family transcriptional regulator [Kutzneria buriramensis]|uniref:PucR-like helix-turn-helix protein n=1 Tax=Kutzneria buriramensis TaxID=1045776 RepID=A0A3E0G816_9PSEU|nr:helix-turn-helix domain-containing protein [Kutzneria buriramensis]REH17973.1 PucR-like helix-turn-helix protein [Kutzneria buriramensis]
MTVIDDRPGQLGQRTAAETDALTALADRLSGDVMPARAREAASALYGEVTRAYARILAGVPEIVADQRRRVRAAGRALVASGGSLDVAADHLGQLAAHLVNYLATRRPDVLPALVNAGNLVLRDLLAATGDQVASRDRAWLACEVVRQLVAGGEIPPGVERDLAASYDILVLRPTDELMRHRLVGLLDTFEHPTILGAPVDRGAVLLIPASPGHQVEQVVDHLAAKLGSKPWCAKTHRTRDLIASGYDEAADILTLAMSSGRQPGLFCLDDFLIEYAVLRQSSVTDSLVAIVKPLLANEMLRSTLAALIEFDFNRNQAAQALFIHRSTLDYRTRRIEEITGYSPTSGRGGQVLSAAMTASAVASALDGSVRSSSAIDEPGSFAYGKGVLR